MQPQDYWIKELEDCEVKEKEPKAVLECEYSKPSARIHWYKNKLEIFQGHKYNFVQEGTEIKLIINRIAMEDQGKYVVTADDKSSSCYLTITGRWSHSSD